MDKLPLVTVYIPTFNRVELLKRAVQSVQNQTYQNLEIIIVDDCSTDGTHDYLEQLAKEDKRVRYFLKEHNSGACVSRNIAIENAMGEFITGLDDDDYFELNRINSFIKESNNNDMNKVVLFSMYRNINDTNKYKFFFKKKFSKKIVTKNDLIMNNYIGNQVFTKTELLKKINGFDENLKMWQDLECWYRLLKDKKAKCIKEQSYILDIDHGLGRISEAKQKKLNDTYNYICLKHSFNAKQRKVFKNHYFYYGFFDLSVTDFVKRVFVAKCLWDGILIFKLIAKKTKFF